MTFLLKISFIKTTLFFLISIPLFAQNQKDCADKLEGKKYGVSRAYDATRVEDLQAMNVIIEKVKKYIHQELNLSI